MRFYGSCVICRHSVTGLTHMDEIARLARPEIYAMEPYSSARIEGTQGEFLLMDANENPYLPYPAQESERGFNRYPEPQPQSLLQRFASIFDTSISRIFLSRGADEAIDLLVRAFCTAYQDSILVMPPTFIMYETAAEIQGAHVQRVPLTAEFQLDVEAILATKQVPKLIFVCSPNNPTGNLLNHDDVVRLADEFLGRALVVVDHIYIEFSDQPPLSTVLEAHPNLVILRSMSKEYSLTGERLGITIAHNETIAILRRLMAPYPLTVSSIRAVETAMTPEGRSYGTEKINLLIAERNRMNAELSRMTHVFPSDANFLLVQTRDASGLTAHLLQHGIKVRNRSGLVPNSVRISIGTPEQNDAVLDAVSQFSRL